MRFTPSNHEITAINSMSDREILEYFITRVAEVEEVWGLGNENGWVMREKDGTTSLPVWPYKKFAMDSAIDEWEDQVCSAISLEHFVFKVLGMLTDNDIFVEIMPKGSGEGQRIEAGNLFTLFESVIESGEYFLEG